MQVPQSDRDTIHDSATPSCSPVPLCRPPCMTPFTAPTCVAARRIWVQRTEPRTDDGETCHFITWMDRVLSIELSDKFSVAYLCYTSSASYSLGIPIPPYFYLIYLIYLHSPISLYLNISSPIPPISLYFNISISYTLYISISHIPPISLYLNISISHIPSIPLYLYLYNFYFQ